MGFFHWHWAVSLVVWACTNPMYGIMHTLVICNIMVMHNIIRGYF